MDEARVTLRAFTTTDLPEFLEWATDDEVTKFLVWESYKSADDALHWLTTTAIPNPWLKAICVDGKAAGSIVVERAAAGMRGEMGYCLARKHWGQGVGTIAVRKMVAMAFQGMPDMAGVDAVVDQRNGASRRVLEKAGFVLEGTLSKHMVVKRQLIDCFLFAIYAAPPDLSHASQED